MNENEYKFLSCRFVFVRGRGQMVRAGEQMQVFDEGENWVLAIDRGREERKIRAGDWKITIGSRGENGDGYSTLIAREDKQLSFESDSMCGVPIFYREEEGIVIVTSDLEGMIEISREVGLKVEVDEEAMGEILISSYIFSEGRTALQDVKIVPRCSALEVDIEKGKVQIQSQAEKFEYYQDSWDWGECVGRLKGELIEGMKRYEGKKVAVMLSGGADSRLIAGCAREAGLEVDYYTFGQSTVNASDFAVANMVAHRLGEKTNCYTVSAENFRERWKEVAALTNWANDSVWWAGKLPREIFEALGEYDVVLRGDGEGVYGWGGKAANIGDVLHMLEITAPEVVRRFEKYFTEGENVFGAALKARRELEVKYGEQKESLEDLKNRVYLEVREGRGIGPCVWPFTRVTAVDGPLLWKGCVEVAKRIPPKRRINKQIILAAGETFKELKGVPRSSGASWNNKLEFYMGGVWEELLDYVGRWSPRPLDMKALREDYLRPPKVPPAVSIRGEIWKCLRKQLRNRYTRKMAYRYFPQWLGSSMNQRLLIRLAVESSLYERVAKERTKVTQEQSKLKIKYQKEKIHIKN